MIVRLQLAFIVWTQTPDLVGISRGDKDIILMLLIRPLLCRKCNKGYCISAISIEYDKDRKLYLRDICI